ncbi:MAG: hypothetical protein HQK53_18075 [Oligoflexia bacterium]|nr:hypothetical protein [Oligoflexia bacterium]
MSRLNFLQSIKKQIKTPFFSDEDLKLVNDDLSLTAIHNALSYNLKTKKIVKIRRGFYCLNNDDGKVRFSKHLLANYLYGPIVLHKMFKGSDIPYTKLSFV